MVARRIAEASVDGNGKGLVSEGGINGCWWSEREMGLVGGRVGSRVVEGGRRG